jgi:hypothetical protein
VRVPSATAYMEALQQASTCFADPVLAAATPALGPLGLPRAISGNVATVFRLDGADGRRWAVRCFVRPVEDERERYEAIAAHLAGLSSPWRVPFEIQPLGVRVDGDWWPILKMAWAPGTSLLPWVERHLWDGAALAYQAVRFAELCERLRSDRVAHGDLQHGNLLVAPGGDLRLVDYDGMWVPALDGRRGTERGHRHYQHPGRQSADFGPGLDAFSSWVIYASLAALAADPLLWGRLDGGEEALLLREHDLAEPDRSAGFAAFEASTGAGVPALGALLRSFLDRDPDDVPALSPATAPRPFTGEPGAGSRLRTGPVAHDQRRSLYEALDARTGPASRPAGRHRPPAAPVRRPPAPTFDTSVGPARVTVAASAVAAIVLAVVGGLVAPALAVLGPVVAAVVGWRRLVDRYRTTPEARAAERTDAVLGEPRRVAAEAAATVARLAAERAAVDRATSSADDEAHAAREELRRRKEDDLARVDDELDVTLLSLTERERDLLRVEQEARVAALVELQSRVVDEHLGHQSLMAVASTTGGVSTQVARRLSLDGVRTAADFTGVEMERTGAVVLARDGRRLSVGGVEQAEATALMAWRRQVVGDAQMKVPTTLPPERVAAIRAEHDARRAALAAEAEAAREHARQRATAVRSAAARAESEVAARRAAAAVDAARRRVDLDRRLVTARKDAAEAQWHLGEREREHGEVVSAGFGDFVRAVAGLRPTGAPSGGASTRL